MGEQVKETRRIERRAKVKNKEQARCLLDTAEKFHDGFSGGKIVSRKGKKPKQGKEPEELSEDAVALKNAQEMVKSSIAQPYPQEPETRTHKN